MNVLILYLYKLSEASSAWSGERPVSGRDEAESRARSSVESQTNYSDHAREVGREGR